MEDDVKNGADKDILSHSIIYNGSVKYLKFLIDNGWNVSFQDNLALKEYVLTGNLKAVKLVVEHGADINIHSSYPLMTSIGYHHVGIFQYLIDKGANLNEDVIDYANHRGMKKLLKL